MLDDSTTIIRTRPPQRLGPPPPPPVRWTERPTVVPTTVRVQPPAPRRKTPARIGSLDGLRGAAAFVVVVYHVFMISPVLAAPLYDPTAPVGADTWLLTYTPLHLAWAGPEAVFVFFVLSGLVLALPAITSGRLNLREYYPRRLVRLYLPVWAAIVFAVALAVAFPRAWRTGDSWWLSVNATDPTVSKVLADAALIWHPGQSNHVLWSLQWEVIYCLLLPAVLLAVRPWPWLWEAKVAAAVSAIVVGAEAGSPALALVPLFVLGTLMAVEHERLAGWAERIERSPRAGLCWALAATVTVTLLLSYWLLHGFGVHSELAEHIARGLQGLGAAGLVFLAWLWPTAQAALTRPTMQWLGSRSFSLYLVHLPIVASIAVVFSDQPSVLVAALPLVLLFTLPVTEVFYRLVERPTIGVARRAGKAVARWHAPARRTRKPAALDAWCAPCLCGFTKSFTPAETPAVTIVNGYSVCRTHIGVAMCGGFQPNPPRGSHVRAT